MVPINIAAWQLIIDAVLEGAYSTVYVFRDSNIIKLGGAIPPSYWSLFQFVSQYQRPNGKLMFILAGSTSLYN